MLQYIYINKLLARDMCLVTCAVRLVMVAGADYYWMNKSLLEQ